MMELGIITDEVSDDFAHACELADAWGVRHVELRQAWGKNVVQLDDDEEQRLVDVVQRLGLRVTAVASPVFKSPLDEVPREVAADFALPGVESMTAQLDLLERACRLAARVGAPYVRVFTFWREAWSDDVADALTDKLTQAARIAVRHDVALAVENEPVCIVATGRESARLCKRLATSVPPELRPYLGTLWDPGNALAAGEQDAYPGGYEALEPCQLVHVHLKDLTLGTDGTPTYLPLGEGEVDYAGQLQRLRRDGYQGTVVLEPHYAPAHLSREEAAHACVLAARDALAAAEG
jgi:sugar phosphate isomerase/epimerase